MMKLKLLLPVFCFFSAWACIKPHSGNTHYTAVLPEQPVNMADINSEYDDYNSTSSFIGNTFPFCFSTNRKSNGDNFDIKMIFLKVGFEVIDGKPTVAASVPYNLSSLSIENKNLTYALAMINTPADEFGPLLIAKGGRSNGSTNLDGLYESYILLYANNADGDLDIKMTENLNQERYTAPIEVKFLNSSGDDAYPSLMNDSSAIYFCSNRATGFDIYKANLDSNMDLSGNLTRTDSVVVTKDEVLSSAGDDKCPYISNKIMVFTSNRPGGYGGFDLWYSKLVEGQWTTPVNFGPAINTAYDEYRPIISLIDGFTNYFMIFSSNRPGGKGGFDLYYVGVDKAIVE